MPAWADGSWFTTAWYVAAWAQDTIVPPTPSPNPQPDGAGNWNLNKANRIFKRGKTVRELQQEWKEIEWQDQKESNLRVVEVSESGKPEEVQIPKMLDEMLASQRLEQLAFMEEKLREQAVNKLIEIEDEEIITLIYVFLKNTRLH